MFEEDMAPIITKMENIVIGWEAVIDGQDVSLADDQMNSWLTLWANASDEVVVEAATLLPEGVRLMAQLLAGQSNYLRAKRELDNLKEEFNMPDLP